MVRLQSVLSKPNGQSRRPHNPHSVLFLDSLSPLPELLAPSSSRIEVLPRLSVLKSYMSRGKKKAHILTFTYLMEMLDRRRSFSHSPTPPACHSLSSPHELFYEVNKAVNQSSFSIVLQIRAVRPQLLSYDHHALPTAIILLGLTCLHLLSYASRVPSSLSVLLRCLLVIDKCISALQISPSPNHNLILLPVTTPHAPRCFDFSPLSSPSPPIPLSLTPNPSPLRLPMLELRPTQRPPRESSHLKEVQPMMVSRSLPFLRPLRPRRSYRLPSPRAVGQSPSTV